MTPDAGAASRPASGGSASHRPRVLILSARVGESHSTMARMLARDLLAVGAQPKVIDDFSSLGPVLDRVLSRGFDYHLGRLQWSYDLAYALFTGRRWSQRCAERALTLIGGPHLCDVVQAQRAEVVVSTHPVLNAVLARLRERGVLTLPAVGVIGPLGGLGFWVQSGLDMHLTMYPEAVAAVEREAGPGKARATRPLLRPEFFGAVQPDRAREQLGLPAAGRIVVVSGGGWGAGDLPGALAACLGADVEAHVLVVVGRNQALRQELERRYRSEERVSVLGFTDRMRDLLCAADVLVSATAGLSCHEARMCGCQLVCYGFDVGHVRDNARALAAHAIARVARDPGQLRAEVQAALADGRREIPPLGRLPPAADCVLELAAAGAARSRQR